MMKKIFKPYSQNVIFFDTEFSSNDLSKGEILSLGMVKVSGEELYLELKHSGEVSGWVKENIVPTLTKRKITKASAIEKINAFVGNKKPYLVSYRIPYDTVYLHKLYGIEILNDKDFIFDVWPIDFATVLFTLGYDPSMFGKKNLPDLAKKLGIDISGYTIHNALDDAKLLRAVYLEMIK